VAGRRPQRRGTFDGHVSNVERSAVTRLPRIFARNRCPIPFPALAALLVLGGCQPSEEELAARHAETIDRYCTDCHNDLEREADLSLEGADLARVTADPGLWEKVIVKLRGNLMPPPGRPRPREADSGALVAYLESRLDAAAEASPDPGRAGIHRLNRTEYGNAIRDLLALEIDPAEFLPADDEAYGFDNIADVLRISPSLLEQYLSASSKIAALAVGDLRTRAVTSIHRAPPDLAQGDHVAGLPL